MAKTKTKKNKSTSVAKKTVAKGSLKNKKISVKKKAIQVKPAKAKKKISSPLAKKTKSPLKSKKKQTVLKSLKKTVATKSPSQVKVKNKSQVAKKNNRNEAATKKTNLTNPFFSKAISPLDDRVFVRLMPEATQTSGGLFIPSQAQGENFQKGEVLSIGRGHQDKKGRIKPLDIRVGDSIVFQKNRGHLIDWQGAPHCLIRESDILGIVESQENKSFNKTTSKK